MLNGTIDLHLHTTCSDGKDSPEEIVHSALEACYTTISITDHDTVAGIPLALAAAEGTGLEVIPGIELSSVDGSDDIHVLGYYIDYTSPDFLRRIAFFKEKRAERAEMIVHNLNLLGLDIQIETVTRIAHGAPVGRPHIAEALLSEELIDTYGEAFWRYIGSDGPAYVPKYKVKPAEAIDLIRSAGGVPVLAHPGLLDSNDLIIELAECGLVGLEAFHPLHPLEQQDYYEKLAHKYKLIPTGGSDWHGTGRSSNFKKLANCREVPQSTLDSMKAYLKGKQP